MAISDVDFETAKEIGEQYGIRAYRDYKDMLDCETLDAVFVATPTKTHADVAVDVMNAGVHCFVEKPIADTIENAERIREAAIKNKVKLMVGHVERFNPVVLELKRRLENNELGKIWEAHIMRRGPFPERIRDVGVVIDLATHDLDIMSFLLNSDVSRVYGEISQNIHTSREDLMNALLRFENGVIGNLNVNWLTPAKIRDIIIIGERGMFKANYITQDLEFYKSYPMAGKSGDYSEFLMGAIESNIQKIAVKKEEPLKIELRAFLDCISNNQEPPVSADDGIKVLKLAESIIVSGKTGSVVRF